MSSRDRITEITGAIEELLLEKNNRYGDSALNPCRIFSSQSPSEGILIRLDDKVSRIKNSGEVRLNDVSDIIGYLVLYLISTDVKREDILGLID
jgi:hypothetical protein